MQALQWNKKGASATIQFGLLLEAGADPGFYVFWDSLLKFRMFTDPHIAFPLMDQLIQQPPHHYLPGPCGVLMARLQQMVWQWQGNGWVLDHEGLPLHLLDCPIQWLRYRAEHAWSLFVGASMADRQEFAGLHNVDVHTSRCGIPGHTYEEQGLLRVIMNGTFCTRNKQVHTGKIHDTLCPWCGEEDSIDHRHWRCPHFADIRANVPSHIMDMIQGSPDCTRLHGWSVHSNDDVAFRRMLLTIEDTTAEFYPVPIQEPVVHLFTDGSCLSPTTPCLRLATWSVVMGTLHDQKFHPVSAGGVPGGYQTVLRAEVIAAISACRFSLAKGHPFCLWTDNETVFKFVRRALLSPEQAIVFPRKRKDHDLWNKLGFLCYQCLHKQLLHHVFKVSSHQITTADTPEVERWAFAGNEHADRLAIRARDLLPPGVLRSWERFSRSHAARCEQAQWLRKVFIDVGQRAVAAKVLIRQLDGEQIQRRAPVPPSGVEEPVSFANCPSEPDLSLHHHMGECHEQFHRWIHGIITATDARPAWVSSHQLLALFQHDTGYLGVRYVAARKGYQFLLAPRDSDEFGFVRIAAWLMALVKCWGRHYGLDCHTKDVIPFGSSFKIWTRCIHICISHHTLNMLDKTLYDRGLVPVTQLTKQLGNAEPFFRS
eukprot:Skav235447  [mRNA]  locus=scaffold2206:93220:95178:+ [translate_table: standard]